MLRMIELSHRVGKQTLELRVAMINSFLVPLRQPADGIQMYANRLMPNIGAIPHPKAHLNGQYTRA